jgi:ferric-chelate reductase
MKLIFTLVALCCNILSTLAYKGECLDIINTPLYSFLFKDGDADDYWGNLCVHNLSVHSMWAAAKVYCSLDEIREGEEVIGDWCTEYGNVTLTPYDRVLPDLTNEYIASLRVVNYKDIDANKIWNNSVLISKSFFALSEKTTVSMPLTLFATTRIDLGAVDLEFRVEHASTSRVY